MVNNAGIDTLGIEYGESLELEKLIENKAVLDKYISSTKSGAIRVAIKPSKSINGGIATTKIMESLQVFSDLQKNNGLNHGTVYRVDIACDLTCHLNLNRNLFRLFLECLNNRRTGVEVFTTKKGLNNLANFKIKNRFVETTIYNCADKIRIGNTRIENRILEIRVKGTDQEKLEYEFKKYINELDGLEQNLEIIENRYIDNLMSIYNLEIGVKFGNFKEFISWADKEGYLLTSVILKGLLEKTNSPYNIRNFIREFRRHRKGTLRFTSKSELKELVNSIKIELKKSLK